MWDKFTFGLNTEGESVNFGTKLSNDDNIYAFETKTLATIHRNAAENVEVDGLSQSIKPISVSHQKSICIAIENSLVIFDATCSQVLLNINFNAKITSYNMCNDGAFLFVALSNLEIYCVQCAMAKYERIFSNAETSFEIKQQSKLPNEIVSIFIEHNESKNAINLFFIFTSGMIVRLSELDINLLEESFNCDNSQEKLENIFANTTHSKLISTLLNSNNAVRAVCDFKRNLFISNGKLLMKCSLDCIDQPDKESSDVDIGISSIKCAMPDQILLKKLECGQRFLFGITSDENLIIICPVTLITLSILPYKTCIDFTVVKGKSEEAILIFTSNKIISVSSCDFSEKYVINLPNSSLPVYNQNEDDPAFEEILFVELSDEKSLTVKVLEETQPDARLKKLLRKGRFEEAKKFCTFFGLDIQIVHRAEAARLFEELMPGTQSKTVTVDEFIVLLELIEDIEFVGDYCINAITADLRDIQKLLNYGMRRVKQTLNRSEQDEEKEAAPDRRALLKLYSMMGSLVQRLNTFIIIQQSPSPSASFDLWISFSKANLLSEVREHLRKGELNAAKIIWGRHWNEIRGKLKYNAVIEMLSELPDSISVQESADWTRKLVGNVLLKNDPSSLASIVDWTVEKALSYDLIDRDSWLEKGISLAELMLDIVLKVEESDAAVGLENILIEKLSAFLTTLRQISCLKLVYHINITYKHFVEDNFNEVAFFLLTESPVDLISDLINDFLMQTLMVKKLDSDLVYSYCIERLLRSLPVGLVYPGAPWEIRAVKIIRAIYTAQVRLECVVSLLKSAAAPLSSFIMETVDEALALNHPLTAAIREQLQLVPSKMVLKKYEFNEIYNTDHMETIMNFIIHSNDENSLADSLIIAKTINMEDDVYLGFIIKFIEEGNHAKILEIMNKLEPEVLERIQTRLNLQANSMRDRVQFGDEESMKRLKRLRPYCSSMDQGLARSCQLELDFNIKSQVADFHSRKRIEELAHKAYKHLIQDGRAEYIVQEASRLTEIFEIAHPYMILEVASMALHEENGELAVELLRYLVDSGSIDHKLCTKLLDFVGEHIFNLTKYMCNTSKPFEIASLLKTVSSMCLESASDITILQAVEISIWVNLITGCQPQVSFFSEDIPSTRLFQFLPEMVTSILKEYASFACAEGSRNRTVHRIFRNTVMPTSNLTVKDIASCVESAVNGLRQMEHNTVALQVVTDLYCCLSSNTKLATETPAGNRAPHVDIWLSSMDRVSWETLCNRCLSDILQKVSLKKVPCKHLNLTVGLAMLNVYTEEEAFCWLNNQLETHLYSANRTKAVAVLGAFYWKLKGNVNLHKKFMAYALKGQWGNKLSKLGLPYIDYINMDKQDVVMRLISMPSVGLDVLRDYCGVDFNDCLLNYMKQLVLSWEPAMTVSVDASGARVLHVKNTADGILMKMKSVSSLVDNHLKFMEFFAITLWKKVNCYYYELYIVLLDLFDHVSDLVSDKRIISKEQFPSMKHYRYILLFLINYRRMSPPSSQEEGMFFVDYNYLDTLPAISEFRLPFTYLVADKYTILKSELSLSTYKLWVSVSTLFCLNKSMLCSLAIYKMNLEKLATTTNKSKEEWCIHVCNEKLLEEIRECVSYIEDKEKACACLLFVVKNLPPGADQVTAANMCYEHTANWAAEDANIGSIAQQMLEKVHKKLLKVSTTHILYKYNLARREYLDLVLNPSMLINCLYHDPAILSKTDPKLVQVHCPDINNAVAEIEKAHQTNLASIKLELLEKWLVPDSNMDDSMISESNNIKSVAKLSEDDNLTRACYLLKNEDANFACNYLVSKAYTNEMQPLEVKLRALQCLINIITPQQIFEATGKDLNSIREYMKSLWFVYGMEQLGLNCSVKMFAARNKSELVAEILSQKSAASAILAAHICREYELHNPVYWNTILKLFTESSMVLVEHLEEFIFRLGIDWYLLDREILSSAWNRLIYLRFFQVDELSEDKDSQVDRIVENINICPSPDLLNKKFIKEQLMRLNSKHVILYK